MPSVAMENNASFRKKGPKECCILFFEEILDEIINGQAYGNHGQYDRENRELQAQLLIQENAPVSSAADDDHHGDPHPGILDIARRFFRRGLFLFVHL